MEWQRPQDTLDGQLVPVSGHDTPRISPQAWLLISGVVSFSEALDIGKQLLFPFLVGFFFHLLYCLFDPALQRMPPHWAQIVGNGGALAVVAAAFAKSFYKPLPVHIMVALGNLIHHVPLLGDKEHENLRQMLGTGLGFLGCKALLQVRAPRHKQQVRFCMWATWAVIAWFGLSPGTAWWLTNEDWSSFHLGQNTSFDVEPAHPDTPWMHCLHAPQPFTYLIVGRCKCENSNCTGGRSHSCGDYFERMVTYVWELEMPTRKWNFKKKGHILLEPLTASWSTTSDTLAFLFFAVATLALIECHWRYFWVAPESLNVQAASRSAPQQGGPGKQFQIEVSFVSEASDTMSRQQDLHVPRKCLSGRKRCGLLLGPDPFSNC